MCCVCPKAPVFPHVHVESLQVPQPLRNLPRWCCCASMQVLHAHLWHSHTHTAVYWQAIALPVLLVTSAACHLVGLACVGRMHAAIHLVGAPGVALGQDRGFGGAHPAFCEAVASLRSPHKQSGRLLTHACSCWQAARAEECP
jgi:hypothetical protein